MKRDVRSAAIGGLAATFVVAVSFAPRLVSRPAEVTVHNVSTEEAAETTSTTAAATTTTAAPTTTSIEVTTTTAAPRTVEERLAVLEATTTTTTAPTPVPPTAIFRSEGVRDGNWTLVFAAYNHPQFAATYPNPRIRFALTTGGDELTAPIPLTPDSRSAEITYVVDGATGPVFGQLVAVDWDGGSLPGGSYTGHS